MISDQGLFPAEHRGLRELHASSNHLYRHWTALADKVDGPSAVVLRDGAGAATALMAELSDRGAAHDVHGFPAAQGVGVNIAGVRRVGDRFLDRNQALRSALLDVQHVITLLDWLEALASSRGDDPWASFHGLWADRLHDAETELRASILDEATRPDEAIWPADQSVLGRAGARVAVTVGTVGEAIDASPLGRVARKLTGR